MRQVSFIGNQVFQPEQLETLLELRPNQEGSPEFNVSRMNGDVEALRELYGGQGFIFANIVAEPRFLEEPGLLDIVYKIEEGKQYYAGEIRVHYEGGTGVTRREVALNRLSVRPGDVINVQKIRNSERRLGSANIFAAGPRIVLTPTDPNDPNRIAGRSAGGGSGSRPTRTAGSGARPSGGSGSRPPAGGSGSRF